MRGGVSIEYFNKLILAKINEEVSKFEKIKILYKYYNFFYVKRKHCYI